MKPENKLLIKMVAVFLFGLIVGGGLVARYGSPINIRGQSSSANLGTGGDYCLWLDSWLTSHGPQDLNYASYRRIYNSQCQAGGLHDGG